MTIEETTKAKLESLSYLMPGLLGKLAVAPEESRYLLVSTEKGMRTFFSAAIVVDGEIFYLDDPDQESEIQDFLAQNPL